ncbi:transposase, partial [Burkholderia cenocepacia]
MFSVSRWVIDATQPVCRFADGRPRCRRHAMQPAQCNSRMESPLRAQFDANRARRKKAVTVSELNPKSWTPTFG